jgi:carboxypeptidase Taq
VEADELTYPLHIILRFQLELGLFRGDLRAADLPGAFNERMRALLGLTPANDAEGVLQDVHWSHGSFGYFPSYLIGSIYAAAIFERAQADLGGPRMLQDLIRAADHRPLREWLREKIHRRGALLPARELMHQVAGLPADGAIDASAYVRHLRERYGALYSVAA